MATAHNETGPHAPDPGSLAAIRVVALGTPAPKGSASAFVVGGKGGARARAVVVPGGSKTGRARMLSWSATVREAAIAAVGVREAPPFVDTPLRVAIEFRVRRPAGHYGTGRNAGALKPGAPALPSTKPDIDKLTRSTLDALTGIVFDDDARIAILEVRKVFAATSDEGARIDVAPASARDLEAGGGRVAAMMARGALLAAALEWARHFVARRAAGADYHPSDQDLLEAIHAADPEGAAHLEAAPPSKLEALAAKAPDPGTAQLARATPPRPPWKRPAHRRVRAAEALERAADKAQRPLTFRERIAVRDAAGDDFGDP